MIGMTVLLNLCALRSAHAPRAGTTINLLPCKPTSLPSLRRRSDGLGRHSLKRQHSPNLSSLQALSPPSKPAILVHWQRASSNVFWSGFVTEFKRAIRYFAHGGSTINTDLSKLKQCATLRRLRWPALKTLGDRYTRLAPYCVVFDHAKTALEVARINLRLSATEVESARQALTDAIVRAPFNGSVTARFIDKGIFISNSCSGMDNSGHFT